jgi:pyruvate kinase
MNRKTKTICTVGPSSENREVLEQLVITGMDIMRVNFSHATFDEYLNRVNLVKEFNQKHNKDVKVLADLQGPRMRVGVLPDEGMRLEQGQEIWFSTNQENKDCIFINDPYIHEDIEVGHPMFLLNGEIELEILEKQGDKFKSRVLNSGTLFSRKGVNLPDTNLTTRGLTEKDLKDLKFVMEQGVDYVAMSFVKDKKDIEDLRAIVGLNIGIVPKIERKQALLNLDEIIQVSDIIMVARGDLGVELPPVELPLVQKDMIKRCIKYDKPAIVATQMLMSMVNNPHPTRAEISDAANAIFDGATYLMLSDETAFGKYPVEALRYLVKTIEKVEEHFESNPTSFA